MRRSGIYALNKVLKFLYTQITHTTFPQRAQNVNMNHITSGGGGGINTQHAAHSGRAVLCESCARECKLKLTRGFCLGCCQFSPGLRRVVIQSTAYRIGNLRRHSALLKIFQLVCARAHSKQSLLPAAARERFISVSAGDSFFIASK